MNTIAPASPPSTPPTTPQRHLYLIDGSAYIFRAYHRLPPLTNPAGVPVGAVYGYTTMLWKLAEDLHKADGPTHLAVILDKGSITFRNALYDQYKANRPPPPEDLVPQFPLIRDATRAFKKVQSHAAILPTWPRFFPLGQWGMVALQFGPPLRTGAGLRFRFFGMAAGASTKPRQPDPSPPMMTLQPWRAR